MSDVLGFLALDDLRLLRLALLPCCVGEDELRTFFAAEENAGTELFFNVTTVIRNADSTSAVWSRMSSSRRRVRAAKAVELRPRQYPFASMVWHTAPVPRERRAPRVRWGSRHEARRRAARSLSKTVSRAEDSR